MGTVLRIKDLVFQIHTHDHQPAHVHVYSPSAKNPEATAKVSLETISVLEAKGFDKKELKIICQLVEIYCEDFLNYWRSIHE